MSIPKWVIVYTDDYHFNRNEYFLYSFNDKVKFKSLLSELNENQVNTGYEWNSYIPLNYILNLVSKISKVLKLDDPYTDAFKYFNKGINSFETCIRKQLVDYRKGDIYD